MSIELHCPKCNKLIRAPDNAGGKTGKCPYCKAPAYIPALPADEEIIPMAPLDEEEERRLERERQASSQYIASIGRGDGVRTGDAEPSPGEAADDVDIDAEVDRFILAMRDSQLDEADRAAKTLQSAGPRAREHVQRLILDEMAPAVENVPPPVVLGFLKNLSDRLGVSV